MATRTAPRAIGVVLPAVVGLAALAVVVLQASLFTAGYRLAADDVALYAIVLQGYQALVEHTVTVASQHGRIGNYAMQPLNAIGSYYSDYFAFRVFAVGLHFLTMYLAASFVSAVLARNLTWFLFLVMVILHPLDFHHLPPTAYPIQNSVPIVLLFLSRLWLWRLRQAHPAAAWPRLLPAYAVFLVAMLCNEYATTLGAVLLLAEHCALIARRYRDGGALVRAVLGTFRSGRLWADAAALVTSVAVYALFRLFNPTIYDGNKPDGLHRLHDLWTTLYMHIVSGTIFPRLTVDVGGVPASALWTAGVVGLLSFLVFAVIRKPEVRAGEAFWTALVGLLAAVIITLPIAVVSRWQRACVDGGVCTYLDGRLSLYPVAVIVTVLCLAILTASRGGGARVAVVAVMALGFAALSSLTYLSNWQTRETMRDVVAGWERATAIACVPPLASADARTLAQLIEPVPRIHHYPHFSMDTFWQAYVKHRAERVDCDRLAGGIDRLRRIFAGSRVGSGQTLSFIEPVPGSLLVSGWHAPEAWGVWSQGEVAEIRITPWTPGIEALGFRFLVYPPPGSGNPPQSIGVSVNGQDAATWSLGGADCGTRVIELAEPLAADTDARVTFTIAAPVAPRDITSSEDRRRLGIGLIEVFAADSDRTALKAWAEGSC